MEVSFIRDGLSELRGNVTFPKLFTSSFERKSARSSASKLKDFLLLRGKPQTLAETHSRIAALPRAAHVPVATLLAEAALCRSIRAHAFSTTSSHTVTTTDHGSRGV